MADLGLGLKNIFMKGMESIGNAASSIATNTKTKVNEMNMVNRRNEILADFGNRAYALWLKGEHFPEELDALLKELKDLDERLNDLRTEKYANIKQKEEEKAPVLQVEKAEEAAAEEETPEEEAAEEEAPAEETDEEKDSGAEVPVIRVESQIPASASSAIENLFAQVPDSGEVSQKVEETLDSIGEGMEKLSREIDEGLDAIQDKLNSEDQK